MVWEEEKEKLGKELIIDLYEKGMIKTWYRDKPEGWKLVSGIWSPFYINLRPLCSYPDLLFNIGKALGKLIQKECEDTDRIVGIAMNGIPIAISISIANNIPSCYTRKLTGVKNANQLKDYIKEYGEHSMVEGKINEEDNLILVDDLVTRFDSKLIAIKQIEMEKKIRNLENLNYFNIVVIFDREQGAKEMAEKHGVNLYALIPFKSKGIEWLKSELNEIEYSTIKEYLSNFNDFQDPDKIKELKKIAT